MSRTPPIRRLLIANRGEIARRIMGTAIAAGIEPVLVYHAAEGRTPWFSDAAQAVEIEGETPGTAYLDVDQLVAVAERNDCEAVHPGYGYLAENAAFARAIEAAGLIFVGPPAAVIELMGEKARARNFVAQHGYPTLPALDADPHDQDFVRQVTALGFPVVVKASAGGGGKGMNIVRDPEELPATMERAAKEAQQYFGDGRIYIERYLESARHIEVQVLADRHGTYLHLGERECSLQRRFQKIVEEAPAPALDDADRRQLCETAIGIARSAKYCNAGTVEFLYVGPGEFFFLEMNTRIQVEHPVTEAITGIDLVAAQLDIAAGAPLQISQDHVTFEGHAIECRVCAEDTDAGFVPATGRVLLLEEPTGEGVRCDSGIYSGQSITAAFDPMLAKLIAHGSDRDAAIAKLQEALRNYVILGARHNIDYLQRVLQHPSFKRGNLDTRFLERHAETLRSCALGAAERRTLCAIALALDPRLRTLEKTPSVLTAIGQWRN